MDLSPGKKPNEMAEEIWSCGMRPRQSWTREQELAVLYLKFHFKERGHPKLAVLAKALNRSQGSLWVRIAKFDFLDPEIDGGQSGVARLTHEIWAEYEADLDGVLAAAERAYLKFVR